MHGCVDAAKLFSGSFWMAWFGSLTPKRHTLWSNDKFIDEIVREAGKLKREDKKRLCPGEPLAIRYTDKSGKTRHKGGPRLKQSEKRA